jgi:hypothetical protein
VNVDNREEPQPGKSMDWPRFEGSTSRLHVYELVR